jgi:mono/diheme cytochrome c family protein
MISAPRPLERASTRLTGSTRAAKPLRVTRTRSALAVAGLLVLGALGCGEQAALPPAEQGRKVYQANCIACHNPDPTRDGALGPAVACSSRELIEARLMRAEYPPGYTPRRDSKLMPAQPYLRPDIPGLAAYLACEKP